jgi:hypothetical protein
MVALSSSLLRAGLDLKLGQIKLATRSYLRDRTNQTIGSITSYAVAAGLFAAAGLFVIAACLVGAAALFRWIELRYGLFQAFGAVGGLLLVIAMICAAIAAAKLRALPPHFPSLSSRLRVAVKANPLRADPIAAATDTATAVLRDRSSPVTGASRPVRRPQRSSRSARDDWNVRAGLILTATLLGWAATRRRQQARRTVN